MKFFHNVVRFLVISVFIVNMSCVYIWNATKTAESPCIRMIASKILFEEFWNVYLMGGNWEEELLKQSDAIASFPLHERLEFYAIIFINCDLDGSWIFLFAEKFEKDSAVLLDYLHKLQKSAIFKTLNKTQQVRLINWISEVEVISMQQASGGINGKQINTQHQNQR